MDALTDKQIRNSLVNASLRERKALTLPADFADIDWEASDFLGWSDPKLSLVGYLVIPVDGDLVGIMLRVGGRQPKRRTLCAFCEDLQLTSDVAFYSAKLAGASGRNGNTVGTLVCSDFACSSHVRTRPAKIYAGDDPESVRLHRISVLQTHLAGFAARILRG